MPEDAAQCALKSLSLICSYRDVSLITSSLARSRANSKFTVELHYVISQTLKETWYLILIANSIVCFKSNRLVCSSVLASDSDSVGSITLKQLSCVDHGDQFQILLYLKAFADRRSQNIAFA